MFCYIVLFSSVDVVLFIQKAHEGTQKLPNRNVFALKNAFCG